MTEENKQITEEETITKAYGLPALKFIQFLALALVAVGFIWGLGDFISSLMPSGKSAPMSILLMLYGVVGALMIEIPIRWLQRKK